MWGRPALGARVLPLFWLVVCSWLPVRAQRIRWLWRAVVFAVSSGLRVIVSLLPGPGPGCVIADFLKASLEVQRHRGPAGGGMDPARQAFPDGHRRKWRVAGLRPGAALQGPWPTPTRTFGPVPTVGPKALAGRAVLLI